MEISDSLLCLFNARIEERGDSTVIEVPEGELDVGDVRSGEVYRVAILEPAAEGDAGDRRTIPEPPVSEGETREVEIEDMGEQGDGIARVERGYIVFVPDTRVGQRVPIEITDVRENFAFGQVVEEGDEGGNDADDLGADER